MKTIDRDTLLSALRSRAPYVLVEPLSERAFREGRIPGALHLPHDRVRELAPTLLPDKSATIIVYGESAESGLPHAVADKLTRLGYKDVVVYPGGKKDWRAGGQALEVDAEAFGW